MGSFVNFCWISVKSSGTVFMLSSDDEVVRAGLVSEAVAL